MQPGQLRRRLHLDVQLLRRLLEILQQRWAQPAFHLLFFLPIHVAAAFFTDPFQRIRAQPATPTCGSSSQKREPTPPHAASQPSSRSSTALQTIARPGLHGNVEPSPRRGVHHQRRRRRQTTSLGSSQRRCLIANVFASVASYETEVRAEHIAAGKAAKAAKIEAIIKAGGTPPVVNKGGRPKGIPNKVTPTVQTMILQIKREKKKVTVIARELNLSRQTVYEVLKRA